MRKLGRLLVALAATALALPGVVWAAEKVATAASCCCPLCCG